jgi:hypothetical protein
LARMALCQSGYKDEGEDADEMFCEAVLLSTDVASPCFV